MKDGWREYWEQRPEQGGTCAWLGHGNVVSLRRRAEYWHSRRFMDALKPSRAWTLLDAGCGAGDEVLRYHGEVKWIVGIDFSPGMLRVCRKRLERLGIVNVGLVAADARALPFKSGAFGGSICMGVLQFMDADDAEAAVTELSRVTRDRMLLHGKNSFSPFGLELRVAERLLARVGNRFPYDHHRPFWRYRRMFAKAGRVKREFTIGLWIPQLPKNVKSLVGSAEVWMASLGLNHPFGKEYYVVVSKKGA